MESSPYIPDVVSDSVTDACRRMNFSVSNLFIYLAENMRGGKGFSNNSEVADHMYQIWCKQGYGGLSHAAKELILEINDGRRSA